MSSSSSSSTPERGTFIGHLTPVLGEDERLQGEGFNARELANIYTAPGWPISMYSEHEDNRRRVGTITRTWLNKEHGWLDVEAKFSLLHPDSVQAWEDALAGRLFLSPSFQHPKPGTAGPDEYYNCLREVSVTRDPYRKGAVMISCHNSGSASVSRHPGSLKLVPNKCGRGASTSVVSAHSRTSAAMASTQQPPATATTATTPAAGQSVPSLDEIKKAIVGKGGDLSDETLRAAVVKFGVNNAPSIKEMITDAVDFSDLESAKKNLDNPQWKLDVVATSLHSLLTAKNKKPEETATGTDAAGDKMDTDDGPDSLFKQFYFQHQKANTDKISTVVKDLLDDDQFKRFVDQLTAISKQPQFHDLTNAMVKLASCGQTAAPKEATPAATHQAPTVSSHSATRTKPANPTDQGIQSALELMQAAAKRRNEEAGSLPPSKAPASEASGGYTRPRFVPNLDG
jgi:hypothetical protein